MGQGRIIARLLELSGNPVFKLATISIDLRTKDCAGSLGRRQPRQRKQKRYSSQKIFQDALRNLFEAGWLS